MRLIDSCLYITLSTIVHSRFHEGVFICFRDLAEFEQNFSFACPKFLSPVPPNYEAVNMMNFHKVSFLSNFQRNRQGRYWIVTG